MRRQVSPRMQTIDFVVGWVARALFLWMAGFGFLLNLNLEWMRP